jgi:heat shock protein HslJ
MRICEILVASLLLSVAGCQGATESAVGADQLVDRSWALESVDGDPLLDAEPRSVLAFGDELKITGLAGCNRFFGQATLEGARLVAGPLGTTRMACQPPRDELEQKILVVLGNGCEIGLAGDRLTLRGSEHTLVYRLDQGG